MKFLLRHLFLVLGCLQLVGGPYALPQAYAWANMLVSYSQETSVTQAVTDTFSGEKPCCLCKTIATEKKRDSERSGEPAPLPPGSAKYGKELYPTEIATLTPPRASPYLSPDFAALAAAISQPPSGPAAPPPRA